MGGRDDEASAHPPVSLGAGRQCLRAVRSPALATKLGHETDVLAVSGLLRRIANTAPGRFRATAGLIRPHTSGQRHNPSYSHDLLR